MGVEYVGAIIALVETGAHLAVTLKNLYDGLKEADAYVLSLVAQLNTINTALEQLQQLMQTTQYDQQLEMDLDLSLQAIGKNLRFLEAKLEKVRMKKAGTVLRLGTRIRTVFESDGMDRCLDRLGHQAMALNLLVSVLTSKSVTEQKLTLQRSKSRKIFQKIEEDKASLVDEHASLHVLRDEGSIYETMIRMKSEPIISKNPWKRFSFDKQAFESVAYGGNMFRRRKTEFSAPHQSIDEDEPGAEHDADAETLVEHDMASSEPLSYEHDPDSGHPPQFSRLLAFGHFHSDITDLIQQARILWQTPFLPPSDTFPPADRLTTRYFDVSIHTYTVPRYHHRHDSEELLQGYKDVSSVLFSLRLVSYKSDSGRLGKDAAFFGFVVNDYNLVLANIILFIDTTGTPLEVGEDAITNDVVATFLRAGRLHETSDRLHIVVGIRDETSAGRVFAVCSDKAPASENKWAGLSQTLSAS